MSVSMGMDMSDPVQNLLGRLDNVSGHEPHWMARCPAHNDGRPSLRVSRGPDGRVLLYCFAGCDTTSILSELGMELSDLFCDDLALPQETIYEYVDEEGVLLFQVVRKPGKAFPQRRPDGMGGWIYNLNGVRRVLYRLPSVLAASPNVVIYAVEGEKDADRLRSYGFVATTSPGGAGKWRDEYSQSLAGRPVVILPDNDEPGRRHAEQVQQSLRGVGARVEILTLQGLPDKGDVSDWLDMGHTDDELDALTAQLWHREQTAEDQPGRATEPQPANEVNRWTPKPLSELVASEVEIPWLWEGYLASGMVTLLTGLWKSGKSTLLSHLLKDLSGAADDFGGQYVREARALVVSEEAERHWITRRDSLLIGDHVSIISRPFLKNPTPAAWEAFLTELQGHVVSGGFNLLVFDSLPNLWAVRNENDNADVKAAILPMNMLTEAGASVLLIAHPAKGDTGEGKATRGAGALPGFVDVIVEMRRYDAENRTDTRRVLTSYSRFDETPVEACLEYIGTAGYRSVGTRSEVTTRSRKETLNTILPTSGDGDTVEDILSNWPGDDHNKPTRGAVAALLNYMASLGEINRSGKGRRGNPYRYRLSLTNPDYLVSNRPISA